MGGRPLVVCTGGEPLLQLDEAAVRALHARGFEVAIETNGTQPPPGGIDHICVSPKADAPLVLTHGQELKLVYPAAATRRPAGALRRISRSTRSSSSRWTCADPVATAHNVRARARLLPGASAVATELADPQAARHSLTGRLVKAGGGLL